MPGARLGMGHLTYQVLISRLGRIRVSNAIKGWAQAEPSSIVRNMNGNPTTNGVSAVPQKRCRRKRGIVPKGGRAVLSPKELELHAQLVADGRLKSGRSGGYDYYVLNGKQRWRRHTVPKDPRSPAQQRCRERFAAASKMWSANGPLTEAQRHAWQADGAKRHSRPRLRQSGPLPGQQNYIGRNCTRNQRDSEMLSHPRQREQQQAKSKELMPESTTQVSQTQPITRSTPGTRRALARSAPSNRRACRGYARKFKAGQLMLQVPRLQIVTRATSDRPHTNTRVVPGQYRWRAGDSLGIRKLVPRKPHRLSLSRGD
jgi:hypothetical protein